MPTRTKRRSHSQYLAARAEVERALGPAQHAYVAAVRALQQSARTGKVYDAIAHGAMPGQIIAALDWVGYDDGMSGFSSAVAHETVTAAHAAYDSVVPVTKRDTPPIPPAVDGLGLSWSARQHAAEAFAAQRAGERVTAIGDSTRAAINDLVTQALKQGWSPDRLATLIKNTVGLHPRYAQAVVNFQNGLEARGLSDGAIQSQVAALRDRYLTLRARTIARTEVAQAQNAGRLDGWNAAADAGAIDRATAQKEWLAGPDPCPECADLDGETVGLDESFSTGDDGPPAHPSCVCSCALGGTTFD